MPNLFDFSSAESSDETGSLSANSDPKLPAARTKNPPKRDSSNQYRSWTLKHELESECYLFYAKSTNVLTIEERTNLFKEHLQNLLQHDQPRAVLACAILQFTSALRQGFPSQSHFMFRPKKPLRFLWKRGSATEAFGRMCPADSAGTPSSTPT
jgi:hypothetical protein